MPAKMRLAQFALDGDDVVLMGFHNPGDLWNGWNKPYATREAIEDYCKRKGWYWTIDGHKIFVNWGFDGESLDYWDEFPYNAELYAYDLSGWCWLERSRL